MLPQVMLFFRRSLVGDLVLASFVLGFLSAFPTTEGWAMFLPSNLIASERREDLAKIQPFLESKIIRQRLTDFGLNQQEISSRLAQLSDQEIHDVASKIDTLQAGGGVLGTIVVLLVIAILVVVLLQLTGHKVIITK
jgi:hypothetical protein